MDIPAPDSKKPQPEQHKVAVSLTSSTAVAEPAKSNVLKPSNAPSTIDDRNKIVAELIRSRKFVLSIKEKHTAPLITLGFTRPRDRRGKKTPKKNLKTVQKKESKKTVESKKAKTTKLVVIGVLWLGAYIALDMGLIDIGWRPPFTIIGPQ